jgi:hypothetical protein
MGLIHATTCHPGFTPTRRFSTSSRFRHPASLRRRACFWLQGGVRTDGLDAVEQPLDGILPQSEYEVQHAMPPAVGVAMRQGIR